ncbi:hypothetical protein Dacet_2599 [Denitrovibrio acetiphilus DSM 12809]|jgi:arsenate reductase-like glutaredoxin family protein|uniref:Glutaredoxin n=1 Tax=Denitrovibrio acetiphilus (strain DSM 12809 / NBRC 114555 / N2460) TaxID=522772 RepID=D4H501_DENA2|nr:ArsC family (seleno)protein [Denitrovibrio acetiphilus]ADD69357.1 hypothetical protein Dacet_2599 [Denitrovibrio acetiphilus DSM 12809]
MMIDWMYFRAGCTSCKKAMAVFSHKDIEVKETVEARKIKIEPDEAWEMLSSGKKIIVAKGNKFVETDTADADRFDILQIAMGRSGTLRAPTIRIGDTWIVGYNEEVYNTKI